MNKVLYKMINDGLKDTSLNALSVDDFSEAIYLRYKEHLTAQGVFVPQRLAKEVRVEILDEIVKVYRMKTYGCFNLKAHKDKKN
jgi:hypothetical protein